MKRGIYLEELGSLRDRKVCIFLEAKYYLKRRVVKPLAVVIQPSYAQKIPILSKHEQPATHKHQLSRKKVPYVQPDREPSPTPKPIEYPTQRSRPKKPPNTSPSPPPSPTHNLQTQPIQAQPIPTPLLPHHPQPIKPLLPTRRPAPNIPLLGAQDLPKAPIGTTIAAPPLRFRPPPSSCRRRRRRRTHLSLSLLRCSRDLGWGGSSCGRCGSGLSAGGGGRFR